MKTAAELWADTIKKQPIDDLTIKHTCESIEELINKKTTGVRLAGLLSRAEANLLSGGRPYRAACRLPRDFWKFRSAVICATFALYTRKPYLSTAPV